MCAAGAFLRLVGIQKAEYCSPTSTLKAKMKALFKEIQIQIKHTDEQQNEFCREWGIDQNSRPDILSRTQNSLVLRAQRAEDAQEEKENARLRRTYVAKIFCATTYIDKKTGIEKLNIQDLIGIEECTNLTYLNKNNVPHIPKVIAASWSYESNTTVLIFSDMGQNLHDKAAKVYKGPLPIGDLSQMTIHIQQCLIETLKLAPNIKHGDIKLSNMMEGSKLIDWHGMSHERNVNLENFMTIYIRAPEVILRLGDYGPEVDTWSFAVSLYEAATATHFSEVTNNDDELEQLHSICDRADTDIPLHMRERSPVQNNFFDENGLKKARPNYPKRNPCVKSIDNARKKLISNLPKEDANRETISNYYQRLNCFIATILKIDPQVRPNHPKKVLQLFYDAGLN